MSCCVATLLGSEFVCLVVFMCFCCLSDARSCWILLLLFFCGYVFFGGCCCSFFTVVVVIVVVIILVRCLACIGCDTCCLVLVSREG